MRRCSSERYLSVISITVVRLVPPDLALRSTSSARLKAKHIRHIHPIHAPFMITNTMTPPRAPPPPPPLTTATTTKIVGRKHKCNSNPRNGRNADRTQMGLPDLAHVYRFGRSWHCTATISLRHIRPNTLSRIPRPSAFAFLRTRQTNTLIL
jgi:hypothetical protein